MAEFLQHHGDDEGWSQWTQPVMRGYKLACCDCGLVHDLEFNVLRVTETNGEEWNGEEMDPEKYRVEFRARRNNRSTGQMRRHDKRRQKTVDSV